MVDALVQIVDQKDRPVRAATRQEARDKGLVCRIVFVIVQNTKGEILLQKRAADKKLWPGRWEHSASGYVDEGEAYETAAYRELMEEVPGIEGIVRGPSDLKRIGDFYWEGRFKNFNLKRFNRVYTLSVEPDSINLQKLSPEVTQLKWFGPDEIKNLLKQPGQTSPFFATVLDCL